MDGYVMIEKKDVLDAIGLFIAEYISTLPEAQNMQPAQLQKALKTSFQVILHFR